MFIIGALLVHCEYNIGTLVYTTKQLLMFFKNIFFYLYTHSLRTC